MAEFNMAMGIYKPGAQNTVYPLYIIPGFIGFYNSVHLSVLPANKHFVMPQHFLAGKKLLWLVFSVQNDCFIYLILPPGYGHSLVKPNSARLMLYKRVAPEGFRHKPALMTKVTYAGNKK